VKRSLQIAIALGLAVAFAVAGYAVYQWRLGLDAGGGERLFATSLMAPDGGLQPLAQWRGKVLVVNFWATWCAPCREEIPELIKYQQRHGTRGLQVIGIAADTATRVAPYAKEIGINYPLLVGGMEVIDFARDLGDIKAVLPFTLVVDREGRIRSRTIGVIKPQDLDAVVLSLL
jgi:thiol-disulfide isomerase/thioredoxin